MQLESLPSEYLAFVGLIIVISIASWIASKRLGEEHVATGSLSWLGNDLLIFALTWKLSPLFFQWEAVQASILALLYLPAGTSGTVLALVVTLVHRTVQLMLLYRKTKALRWWYSLVFVGATALIIITGSVVEHQRIGELGSLASRPFPGVEDRDGRPLSLESQRTMTIINNWASWCPPCRAEFVELEHLFQQLDSDVGLVAINMTTSEKSLDDAFDFLNQVEPEVPQYFDTLGQFQQDQQILSLPTTIIVDRQGNLLYRRVGAVSAELLMDTVARLKNDMATQ